MHVRHNSLGCTDAPGLAGHQGVHDVLVVRQHREDALQQLSRKLIKRSGSGHAMVVTVATPGAEGATTATMPQQCALFSDAAACCVLAFDQRTEPLTDKLCSNLEE